MTSFPTTRAWVRWPLRLCIGMTVATTSLFVVCATLGGAEVTPPPPIMDGLLLTAIGGAALTLVLLALRGRRRRDKLFLLLLPLLFFPFVQGAFMIPASDVAHVRLTNGRIIHLSYGPELTDVTYHLWQEERGGWWWRRLPTELSYSEDGRFIRDERLSLSRDGRRLLVRRGGIWTDCVQIDRDLGPCDLDLDSPNWSEPDYEARMRANSAAIETMRR